MDYNKPFLKWVGGKNQILEEVFLKFPKSIDTYYEPFLGGGSVLIELLRRTKNKEIKVKKIYAYDLNESLISCYRNIQINPKKLCEDLNKLEKKYNKLQGEEIIRNPKNLKEAYTSKESYYYWIRNRFNSLTQKQKNTIGGTSIFIFLNKTCFRGMYRTGKNGFNVPFGHYKKIVLPSEEHINKLNSIFQNVIFECKSFQESLKDIKQGDFVYMDPPYVPINKTSFVSYNSSGFDEKQHKELFDICNKLVNKNIKFLMSNSDTQLIKESITNVSIINILCKRHINSKNPGSRVMEVLVFN